MNAPPLVRSFPPLIDHRARLLVLGSMPGAASLRAQQYYAHPRNAFWPIMGSLVGALQELPYEARCEKLRGAGIGLWDVLRECRREGSLDAAIESGSERANDLPGLLADHPALRRILFNGQKAESAWMRSVWPTIDQATRERLVLTRLPSTSPAHASRSFDEKLALWREAFFGSACEVAKSRS